MSATDSNNSSLRAPTCNVCCALWLCACAPYLCTHHSLVVTCWWAIQAQAPQAVVYQTPQAYVGQPQQAPPSIGSQGSGQARFQFQPLGQPSSPQSQSTPSLSGRSLSGKSVPRFLEEAWARGEPSGPPKLRPGPPPLPGKCGDVINGNIV